MYAIIQILTTRVSGKSSLIDHHLRLLSVRFPVFTDPIIAETHHDARTIINSVIPFLTARAIGTATANRPRYARAFGWFHFYRAVRLGNIPRLPNDYSI